MLSYLLKLLAAAVTTIALVGSGLYFSLSIMSLHAPLLPALLISLAIASILVAIAFGLNLLSEKASHPTKMK